LDLYLSSRHGQVRTCSHAEASRRRGRWTCASRRGYKHGVWAQSHALRTVAADKRRLSSAGCAGPPSSRDHL